MRTPEIAQRLTIYIGESDRWRNRPLYVSLLEAFKREDLAGATVLRGVAGFGAHSRIHTASILRLSEDLPLIVELVDTPENITRALAISGPMVREGLITIEDVRVLKYSHRFLHPLPGDRAVREIMTPNPITASPETPLADIIDILLRRDLKALPVLGARGEVLGIISDGDLIERGGMPTRLAVAEALDQADLDDLFAQLKDSTLTANDIMSSPVTVVGAETPLAVAAKTLVDTNLKRMPVVDSEGVLIGMLSRYDLLAAAVPYAEPLHKEGGQPAKHLVGDTVEDVMTLDFVTVHQDTGLAELVESIVGTGVRRLVVIDDSGRAVGVVTDGDLVARTVPEARRRLISALGQRDSAPSLSLVARDLMSPDLLKGPPSTSVRQAIRQMLTEKRKRFYVVDQQGHVVGAVDRQRLVAAIIGEARDDRPGAARRSK